MCERRTENPSHILKQREQQKTQINAIDMPADTFKTIEGR